MHGNQHHKNSNIYLGLGYFNRNQQSNTTLLVVLALDEKFYLYMLV